MTTILVTGSSGFIARHLIPAICRLGFRVHGLDLKSDDGRFSKDCDYRHFQGDVRDAGTVEAAMKGTQGVIHLAAAHHDFGVPDEEYFDVNVDGTQTLLDATHRNSINDFLFYSSVAVYGAITQPTHEEIVPAPESPYGQSKLEAERRLEEWQKGCVNRRAIVVRPTVVFGPHNYANMYNLIHSIARNRFVWVGRGDKVKSVAYIDNVIEATMFLWQITKPGLVVVNFADAPHLTAAEIVETVSNGLGKRTPRLTLPYSLALWLARPLDWVAKVTNRNLPITSQRIRKLNTATQHHAPGWPKLDFSPRSIHARAWKQPFSGTDLTLASVNPATKSQQSI